MNKPHTSDNFAASSKDWPLPRVLGIGGTLRPGSSSEFALRAALRAADEHGAQTEIITAAELNLPMYNPEDETLVETAQQMIEAVRRADGLIIATPAYHGGASGLLKNALDYLQVLMNDPTPYIHNKAVGCIVTAAGWQAGATTLTSLRSTVHALRGWPTPLGVTINSVNRAFSPDGDVVDPKVRDQLTTMGMQVVAFARAQNFSRHDMAMKI